MMGYKGKKMESKGTKRERETERKSERQRERDSVKGKQDSRRMRWKEQQKQALMHLYTHSQGPLLMQTHSTF